MSSAADVSLQMRAGLLTGMGVGGALAGKWCARSCAALNPEHAMIYGAVNAIAVFVMREFAKSQFKNEFTDVSWVWQMVCIIPATTLVTGAIADVLGVPLMVLTAAKIALGSAAGGIIGAFVFSVIVNLARGKGDTNE